MSINPFVDPNADDDLFETAKPQNTSNSSVVQYDANLPTQVQKALTSFFKKTGINNSVVKTTEVPHELKVLSDIVSGTGREAYFYGDGPLIIAMAELLNETSNGLLEVIRQYHESRRVIIWAHATKRQFNFFSHVMDHLLESGTIEHAGKASLYSEIVLDFIEFKLDEAIFDYRNLSERLDRLVDEHFIITGRMTQRTEYDRVALGWPWAEADA